MPPPHALGSVFMIICVFGQGELRAVIKVRLLLSRASRNGIPMIYCDLISSYVPLPFVMDCE